MKKLTASLFFLLIILILKGQDGSPLLTHFLENRDAENQNWAICQDRNNVMLFANRKGILTFDGIDWTQVRMPATPYVLKYNRFDETVYVGGENSFGTISRDNRGVYHYKPLYADSVSLGIISRMEFNDSLAIFYGDRSVSCYNFTEHRITRSVFAPGNVNFTGAFLKGTDLFINVAGSGLHRIDADTLFPIVTGYITANTDILFSLPYDENRIVLGLGNSGLSLFDGIKYYDFVISDDGYISSNVLYEGIPMGDTLYAFSTLGGGAVVAEVKTGIVKFVINNQRGLPDDEVLAMGSDRSGGLWLSHNFGLTRADLRLPVRNYGIYPGLTGNLTASLNYNNELYVATSEGVFYLANEKKYTETEVLMKTSVNSTTAIQPSQREITSILMPPAQQENTRKGILTRIFGKKEIRSDNTTQSGTAGTAQPPVSIQEVPQPIFRTERVRKLKSIDYVYRKIGGITEKCRQLVPVEGGILAATNRGLYIIRNRMATAILQDKYINYISWKPFNGVYAIATTDGYYLLYRNGRNWNISMPDETFREPVYSVVHLNENDLWIGGNNKVLRADISQQKVNYEVYSVENSFIQKYLTEFINDTLFLFTETSINYFDKAAHTFVPCKFFGDDMNGEIRYPVSNLPLAIAPSGLIYTDSQNRNQFRELGYLKLFNDIVSLYSDNDQVWIVDGRNNLYGINRSLIETRTARNDLLIKSVRDDKGTLFDLTHVEFERGQNVINFEIVSPSYYNKSLTEYQYLIDDVMSEWSPWSSKTSYSRGIPKPGDYELLVRSRDMWGQVGEPVSLKFTIKAPFTQTTLFYMIVGIACLGIILLLIVLRERQLQEKNRILEEKVSERTAEIEAQKEEITSSITYASRLQMAMLPVTSLFSESFSEYFIIFKPRDIVSGDFYWIGEDNKNIYFTVADCTGHGVPGAFMSTLGISMLNEIINHNHDLKAGTFLNLLRDRIKTQLHQTGKDGEAADGLDISLCVLRKDRKLLQYSGAFNPLFIFIDGELRELKADRMPIGIHYGDEASFSNHEIPVKNGDLIYLLSDGLTDQFGGSDGSKFKKARLKKLLSDIHYKPLSDQKKLIELEFLKWKSSNEQVDDVTVIGVRI